MISKLKAKGIEHGLPTEFVSTSCGVAAGVCKTVLDGCRVHGFVF